jgi:hypothetical protein
MQQSVLKLGELGIESLLPGHGIFPIRGGQAHVDRAIAAFDSMVPPGSILQ